MEFLPYNTPRMYAKTCGCYASQEGFFFCPLHAAAPLLLEACKIYANPTNWWWDDERRTWVWMLTVYPMTSALNAIAAAEKKEHNG